MKKIKLRDVYEGRIEEIDNQLRIAKRRNDRVTIVKLTKEKKRLELLLQEQ